MGTLALDIETASPNEEPPEDSNETRYFEWVAMSVGYRDDTGVESDVLFRQGDWDHEYTAELLDQFVEWCEGREIDRTLTYNGDAFDLKHLRNWATELEDAGVRRNAYDDLRASVPMHIDLAPAATEKYPEEATGYGVVPLWKACELESIDDDMVFYRDYDFPSGIDWGIDRDFVQGKHVGQVLGERFVEGQSNPKLGKTRTHQELQKLLYDYASSDVDVLFGLYDALGGAQLEEDYHHPFEKEV